MEMSRSLSVRRRIVQGEHRTAFAALPSVKQFDDLDPKIQKTIMDDFHAYNEKIRKEVKA